MAPPKTAMKVVKKKISKSKKRQTKDVGMGEKLVKAGKLTNARGSRRKALVQQLVAHVTPAVSKETPEQIKKRHAEEWKAMKAQVALEKKNIKKLPTTGGKSVRVEANQKVKAMVKELELRHEAETKAAKMDGPLEQGWRHHHAAPKKSRSDKKADDEDMDEDL
eukprot:TRINITY_DN19703_c0_g1_i1.p2 TRINITY_DN19703_c0_g1~~TRINITY_DN19703_c0_g1_i1.p2  ORF type:complete len:164 (+),score=72.40 TRINITY_DN19703_c0_g1_i1:79-570(+)